MTWARLALTALVLVAVGAADWRGVATADDRQRLREWRDAWTEVLDAVRDGKAAADMATLARDPALFDPDDALDQPLPGPGAYRCRLWRLRDGRVGGGGWGQCRITPAGGLRRFEQVDGVQRIAGLIYDDVRTRGVLLGTRSLAEEHRSFPYGHAAGRDTAGFVERIGERRWRLVLPSPPFGGRLDLIELMPAD